MKILVTGVLAACAMSGIYAATLDGIAARIDGEMITVGDVMAEIRRNPEARERFTGGDAKRNLEGLYKAAVDTIIDRKLMLRAAAQKKMDMQEWVVDNRVREIVKENFGGDKNKLESLLAETRTPFNEWRNVIREDLIVAAMRYQMVEKYLSVTPAKMRAEYENNKSRYAQKASASVRVILLKPADGAGGLSVSTRGEEILGKLDRGDDFGALAREHSADSHAAQGGLWKDVDPAKAFRPEIADVISKLKPGEYSRLTDIDGWGFIVRKDAETVARERTFAEAYDDIAKNVRRDEAKVAYEAWMQRLRAASSVTIYPMPEE